MIASEARGDLALIHTSLIFIKGGSRQFPARRFAWVVITTLSREAAIMVSKIAQTLVNTLPSFS